MYSITLLQQKSPIYTFRCLFHYIVSTRACIFLLNSAKVSILTLHALPRPWSKTYHVYYRWKALFFLYHAMWSIYGHFLCISNQSRKFKGESRLRTESHWLSFKAVFSKWVSAHTLSSKTPLQKHVHTPNFLDLCLTICRRFLQRGLLIYYS